MDNALSRFSYVKYALEKKYTWYFDQPTLHPLD